MKFLNTEMYMVTFWITVFELVMLIVQVIYFLERKSDQKRLLYLILLVGMIMYNMASGFLPDKQLFLPIPLQNGIAYFVSFCTSMYYVWYFYKAFELDHLRFFTTYGSFFFLFVPFVVLFVVPYYVTGSLALSRQLTVVIPFFYGIAFVVATRTAFIRKFKEKQYSDRTKRELVIAAYIALLCWVVLPVIVFFGDFQVLQHSVTNAGFMVLTIVYIRTMIDQSRMEYNRLMTTEQDRQNLIDQNCSLYGLTPRETEIVKLIVKGISYKVIGDQLHISEKTVAKHASNIFLKMGITNKVELILRLESTN